MADERLKLDKNNRSVSGGVTNDANLDIVQFRIDPSTKRLLVDNAGSGGASTPTNLSNGQGTVAAAGTAVQVAASTTIQAVIIRSDLTNANNLYVGDSGVDSSNGLTIAPGEAVSFDIDDPSLVYVDADDNGATFSFLMVI